MMISNEQINECKNKLLERQNELIEQLNANDHFGMSVSSRDTTGELSLYDNHPADMGTELYERGKDTALNEHAEKELEDINKALHAINEGTYGICSVCGGDIPAERLLAMPTADRCTEHAGDQIFTNNRPVEEQVFSPNINPNEKTDEEQVGYDAEDAYQDVSKYGSSDTPSDLFGDQDNYGEVFPNSDERIGSTENVEDVITSNIYGKQTGYVDNYEED